MTVLPQGANRSPFPAVHPLSDQVVYSVGKYAGEKFGLGIPNVISSFVGVCQSLV